MRNLWLFILLSGIACMGGCIVPFPHVKKTCGPIEGTVVDARTNIPISNATVRAYYPDGGDRSTRTDEAGKFRFAAKCRFHWGFRFAGCFARCCALCACLDRCSQLLIIVALLDWVASSIAQKRRGVFRTYTEDAPVFLRFGLKIDEMRSF